MFRRTAIAPAGFVAVLLVMVAALHADAAWATADVQGSYDYDGSARVVAAAQGTPGTSTTRTIYSRTRRPGRELPADERFAVVAVPDRAKPCPKKASAGWKVWDDVYSLTRAGNEPARPTVRGRYWKNVANDPAQAAQWDEANLARMRAGMAPQRFNPDKGGMESMELSHEPIPAREGGRDFVPRWPQDHAAHDPYSRPGY